MACVRGIYARIFTWELVTGFGQNPTEENLVDYFRRDFSEVERLPKFWKLISFNSSEGRHHRYLVILAEQECLHNGRNLPASLFLYTRADEQMGAYEGNGNFRYAALVGETLYVLVFYEGRLCHWSEERGYGGARANTLAKDRLRNLDEFLRRDPLFSQAEAFQYGVVERLDVDFGDTAGAWVKQLRRASRDPFWKGLRLEPRSGGLWVALSIILLLMLMVAGFLTWKNLDSGCEKLVGPEAPLLTPPATEPISKETRISDIVKVSRPKNVDSGLDCQKPILEIRGIVGDRLFSGVLGGEPVMKQLGDSLGNYRVKSVLRDRVVLECGGRDWEVVNGRSP